MDRVDHIKQVGDKLNKVGCGFCPMKWLHETLYLHTGDNHSCYHPKPQHIPLEEIEKDPSLRPAFTNYTTKKNPDSEPVP